MQCKALLLTLAMAATFGAAPAEARNTFETPDISSGSSDTDGVLQCVPYARAVSGIAIYGDAYTWWDQAKGRYKRGSTPKVGAVMALQPHGNSRLGHVAAVSGVIDSRTILLRHANWSAPGMIEDNVRAVDVSADNDWSKVRIWYGPSQALGSGEWPLYGFIYNERPGERRSTHVARVSGDMIADIIAGRIH